MSDTLNSDPRVRFWYPAMTKPRNLLFILTSLALLVPVNIYSTGTGAWTAYGIQWGLVRYQHAVIGDHLVSFSTDLYSVLSQGIASGSDAFAVLVWGGAVLLLIAALILNAVALWQREDSYVKRAAGLTVVAGLFFLIADIVRFGLFLHGGTGWCLPIGIPTILLLGIWGLRTDLGATIPPAPRPVSSDTSLKDGETVAAHFKKLLYDREVISLALLTVLVMAVVFFAGMLPNISFETITGDLYLYHWYATAVFYGHVPYAGYYVPYPQLFFVPVFLALIPAFSLENATGYMFSFSSLMILCDIATLLCVYSLAERFFGKEKAFLCGLLYATGIGAAFFVPITFDALPTFLMVFSLWLFLFRRQVASCLSATVSMLMKWFAALCFPYYLIYAHKNGSGARIMKKPLLLSVLLTAVVVVPVMLVSMSGFLKTYQSHFTRSVEIHSLVYYLDTISSFIFHVSPFDTWSFVLLVAGELVLLYWYFRYLDGQPLTLVYLVFAALLLFVLINKVFSACYLIWLTPFLALILVHSRRRVLLFYLAQAVIYLETPVLFKIVYGPLTFGADPRLYYTVLDNSLPSFSFIFYTVKFAVFFAILWVCIRDVKEQDPAIFQRPDGGGGAADSTKSPSHN